MMNTWTLQMGYPLVTFSLLDNSSSTWLISQSRFLLSAQVSIFWQAFCQMRQDDKLLLASVHLYTTFTVFIPFTFIAFIFLKFTLFGAQV